MASTSMSLSKHWQDFIQSQIESGRYASASDVVRESLRLLEVRTQKLDALRAMVADGQVQAERGEIAAFDAEDTIARAVERAGAR